MKLRLGAVSVWSVGGAVLLAGAIHGVHRAASAGPPPTNVLAGAVVEHLPPKYGGHLLRVSDARLSVPERSVTIRSVDIYVDGKCVSTLYGPLVPTAGACPYGYKEPLEGCGTHTTFTVAHTSRGKITSNEVIIAGCSAAGTDTATRHDGPATLLPERGK